MLERLEDPGVDDALIGVLPGGDEHLGEPRSVDLGGRPQHRLGVRGQLPLEMPPEAEAVAAIEGLHVLDRVVLRIGRESGELEQGRPGRAVEELRLACSGDDGLDRLLRRVELDPVVGMEQLVQGDVVAERGGDPVEALGVQEEHLDRDRLAVGEAETLDPQHLRVGVETQRGRDIDPGLDAGDRDQLGARDDPARPHLLGMARQPERLLDLRKCDEGALALAAEDPLLGLEALQHVADGRARDAVVGAQLALGGQGGPGRPLADELEQRLAQAARLRLRDHRCACFRRLRCLFLDHGAGR